jgi:hypothetical protein
VESFIFWFKTLDSEFLMDGIIGFDPFRGGSGFHGDDFNLVAVIDIADNDFPFLDLTGNFPVKSV